MCVCLGALGGVCGGSCCWQRCFVLWVGSDGKSVATGWMSGPAGMYILCGSLNTLSQETG